MQGTWRKQAAGKPRVSANIPSKSSKRGYGDQNE